MKGNDFVFRLETETPDTFEEVSANTALSMSIGGEEVNISTKDADGWRQLLDGGGEKTVSVSGEGVYGSATYQKAMRDAVMSGALQNCQVDDGEEVLEGSFQVTQFEHTGDVNGAQLYTWSIESAAEPTVT